MSIEQLKTDWDLIKQSAAEKFGKSPALATANDLAQFLSGDLLPWMESFLEEVAEIDESVGTLVLKQDDVLHEESAEVFAGIIASGRVLIGTELRTRVGNDRRLLKAIEEWMGLAEDGEAILNDVTVPDPDDDGEDLEPEEPDVAAPADGQAGDQ